MSDILDGIRAHIKRADDMLTYLDKSLDEAVDKLVHLPVNNLRFGVYESVLCVIPAAPIDKIIACLSGGGVVTATIGTQSQWANSLKGLRNTVLLVQVLECSQSEMKVKFTTGETDIIKDPRKQILEAHLLWVGG